MHHESDCGRRFRDCRLITLDKQISPEQAIIIIEEAWLPGTRGNLYARPWSDAYWRLGIARHVLTTMVESTKFDAQPPFKVLDSSQHTSDIPVWQAAVALYDALVRTAFLYIKENGW